MTVKEITDFLSAHEIKPSYQRIKVYEELFGRDDHPTVDAMYQELIKTIPTLSKTTIYNSLKTYVDKGIVNIVATHDSEMHYDPVLKEHNHFRCRQCHTIYNCEIDPEVTFGASLTGFQIDEVHVLLKGICRNCLDKKL